MIEPVVHVFACACETQTRVETHQMNCGCVFECPACRLRWQRVEVNMRPNDWIKA